MHALVCLLRAGQPNCTGDAAISGAFIGEISWVIYDKMVMKGLNYVQEVFGDNTF